METHANLTLDSKCRQAGNESKILLLEQKILELESKVNMSKNILNYIQGHTHKSQNK